MSCSISVTGQPFTIRVNVCDSQASGSTPFILQVYADRRTMPSVSFVVCSKPCVPGQFGGSLLFGTRHSSHAQRAFRNSRSRSLGRNRSALARSYGFSFASADSSVRDAHEDRSTSFPSLRGPTTGQLRCAATNKMRLGVNQDETRRRGSNGGRA